MRDGGGLNGLCVCVLTIAQSIMATRANASKNHTINYQTSAHTSHTVTYRINARQYLRANALMWSYFSLAALMLLIWQAYQHCCPIASQITIKTRPIPASSTRNHYNSTIYRFTSCSGSFLALFSLFSCRFRPFSGFERLDSVTAALGRVSAHCSATCAVIGRSALSRNRPLAGTFDWWLNRPFALCLCILLSRKTRTSRNNNAFRYDHTLTFVVSQEKATYTVYIRSFSYFKHFLKNITLQIEGKLDENDVKICLRSIKAYTHSNNTILTHKQHTI